MNVIQPFIRQAHARPEAPALIAGERIFSYRELHQRTARLASRLSQAGVRPGDVVGVMTSSMVPQVTLALAIAWLGAASIPVSRREVASARDFGLKLLVHKLDGVTEVDAPGVKTMSLDSLTADGEVAAVPMHEPKPGDTWRIGMSSGTTGRPKAILNSHGATLLRAQLSRVHAPQAADERLMVYMGMELTFSATFWLRTLHGGGAVVRAGQSAPQTLEQAYRHGVTLMLTSSGNAIKLAQSASESSHADKGPLPKLQTLCMGGAAVAPGVQDKLRKHVCATLRINYGASEMGMVALLEPGLQAAHPACAGRVVPWVEAEAVDERDQPLKPGEVGRLRMRSPSMASGYLLPAGSPPEDPPAFRGGWFHSGDLGAVTPDGLVYLGGRGGEVLNLDGNKIEPSELEKVIERDPAILEAAVFAARTRDGVMALVALVVSNSPVDEAGVKKRCQEALGRRKVPAAVVQVDSLPRNEAGKVIRKDLPALLKSRLPPPREGQ